MLLRSLFLKTLRDLRGQILGWGLGIGSLGWMIIALYPSFKDQMAVYADLIASFPPALTAFFGDMSNLGDWSGWLNVEFFSWVPPILAVFAVAVGTGLIAGEEEKGTLDLLLSQPIHRWRVVAEKSAALVAATVLIVLLAAVCMIAGSVAVGETKDLARLTLATLDIAPVTLASGAFALMASVVLRRKRLATATAVIVVVGSWFLDALGKAVNVLKPYRPFTLFHYYNGGTVMSKGMEWGNAGVLLGLTALFFAVSLIAFQRRDIAI